MPGSGRMTTGPEGGALGAAWPAALSRDTEGHLTLGGFALVNLADRAGAPLYLLDGSANRSNAREFVSALAARTVSIVGRYCESGDVILPDALLPPPRRGDLLAFAGAGAYTLSMASTYNAVPRPAVVLVENGVARLIQRRETVDDLRARDYALADAPIIAELSRRRKSGETPSRR